MERILTIYKKNVMSSKLVVDGQLASSSEIGSITTPHPPAKQFKALGKFKWSWFFGRKFCFSSSWTAEKGAQRVGKNSSPT